MPLRTPRATLAALAALGLAGLTLVPPSAADATAAMCAYDHSVYKSTGSGSKVWIGTDQFSTWTQGPTTITRTYTHSAGTSSSTGSSDTVGGGVDWKVVSAEYNHTWDRSTTSSSSHSTSWSYSIKIPAGVTARARLYHAGWSFPVTKTVIYEGGPQCDNKVYKFRARVPVSATGNQTYCFVRDGYPGTKVIGGCVNH